MRYLTCAAAIMLLAFVTTGCQSVGSPGCGSCADSGMMMSPGCGCDSGGCASGGCASNGSFSGDARSRSRGGGSETALGGIFGSGNGNSGACSCGNAGCNGGSGYGNGNGYGNGGGNGYGNGGGNGGGNGYGNGGGPGSRIASNLYSARDLASCRQCMGLGFPCGGCLAPGGRLCHLGAGAGILNGARGLVQGGVQRLLGHDCQTPHTVPYAQGGGMGGPGPGGPTPHYGYPYYTTRAPRDFLMANPPSIGP